VLPNMIASHISIAQDARGPNNTIHQAEVSGLLAVSEAASVIQRGMADVMMAGGASSLMHPFDFIRRWVMGTMSPRRDDPETIVRPFDACRDGQVWSEGAAVLVLESRRHADARGAKVLARLLGCASTCEPIRGYGQFSGEGLCRAMQQAMARGGLAPSDLGHVNARGLSTPLADRIEAQCLHRTLPDVPVTALKGYFGNLGAAGASLELAASVLSLSEGLVPAIRNYDKPDPECPIPVIHGSARPSSAAAAMNVTWTSAGQSTAVALGRAI
jgi:3-oxoacyl-[acyl-carrier-protein] synthase II